MKVKNYEIQAHLSLLANITVKASSLEDALEQSKKLSETDFVAFDGDFMDGETRITGVYETNPS